MVRVFGTDGEKALIDAFSHEFCYSQHLTCFLHVRRNIQQKLHDCNVPIENIKQILDDIFGRNIDNAFEEGLVDASDNDDFHKKLDVLGKNGKH